MRAKHALAREADLLGDALRRDVVRVRDELQTLELEFVECVSDEKREAHACSCLGRALAAATQYPMRAR